MAAAFTKSLRLRSLASGEARKVTWLELFFDLVFAAAVAQVAGPLRDDYSVAGLIRFTILFVLIWWAWTGHAVFSTRFDSDDGVHRSLTFLQMFAVAVMAANARDALDSRSSAGFAAAYAVLRFVLVVQYFRAISVTEARPLTMWYLVGHGIAAALWLVSSVVDVPVRYAIWTIAFFLDLGTPWGAIRHSVSIPPHPDHLPERFGLFTLILLGESIVAVMHGIEHQEYWSVPAASAAMTGMAIAFAIWWWYFDAAHATTAQPVQTHADAVRLHAWSYAHLPLYLGLVVAFMGIQLIVSVAPLVALSRGQFIIIAAALAGIVLSLAGISVFSGHDRGTVAVNHRHGSDPSVPAVAALEDVTFAPLLNHAPFVGGDGTNSSAASVR